MGLRMGLKAAHVQEAFSLIRKNGISPNAPSTKWDVIDPITKERFPPKAVLRTAKELADDTSPGTSGGWPTNDPLMALGYDIALKPHLEISDEAADLSNIPTSEPNEINRQRLVNARLGQGGFREALLELWNEKCAVTGCDLMAILRASHIKPWRNSNNVERLDPANGILLAASPDALFDSYLISFSETGAMLVNPSVQSSSLEQLGIPKGTQLDFRPKTKAYLIDHRSEFDKLSGGSSFVW